MKFNLFNLFISIVLIVQVCTTHLELWQQILAIMLGVLNIIIGLGIPSLIIERSKSNEEKKIDKNPFI